MSSTQEQKKIMEGLRTFPVAVKTTKAKKQTPHSLFKENCHEDFEEPQIKGWSQVDAPYGGVYASGLVLTKKFRESAKSLSCFAGIVEKLPKRHFLTLESAVEFAEVLDDSDSNSCEAITKTTAGYELRAFRCAIKNTPSGFNSGLRTWLRDSPLQDSADSRTYASLNTCLDAHIMVRTPAQAKKIHNKNRDAVNNFLDLEAEEEEVEESVEVDPEEEEEEEDEELDAQVEVYKEKLDKFCESPTAENKKILILVGKKTDKMEEKLEAEKAPVEEDEFSVGGFTMTNPDMELDWDLIDSLRENEVDLTDIEEKIIRLHLGAGTSGPTEYWDHRDGDEQEVDGEAGDFIIQGYMNIEKDEKFTRVWSPNGEEVLRFNEEELESYMIRQFV